MTESGTLSTELLVDDLRQLCALPSSHEHADAIHTAADQIAALMRQRGLHSQVIPTTGAPLVVGRRAGRSPWTLLLYHQYDTAAAGPWRLWKHDPFQLAERDGALFARGVASGKGALAAHLAALHSLQQADGELPISVVVVADGEALIGSPHLGAVVAEHRNLLRADACLAVGGERGGAGRPICYSGAKGLLQLRLTALGANQVLPAGVAASVPNPLWKLIWALSSIKSKEEEILIDGFYDDVESLPRSENQVIRKVPIDEAGRLGAWGIEQFLFGLHGPTLTTAEATLPTCNVASLSVEPLSDYPTLPVVATARLDFQLVSRQRPQTVVEQLRNHLLARDFGDITVERLIGGYPAVATPPDHPFIEQVRAAGQPSGSPLDRLPLGPFALPLFFFSEAFGLPVATYGCTRPDNAVFGANEQIPLRDLVEQGQMLQALLASYEQQT